MKCAETFKITHPASAVVFLWKLFWRNTMLNLWSFFLKLKKKRFWSSTWLYLFKTLAMNDEFKFDDYIIPTGSLSTLCMVPVIYINHMVILIGTIILTVTWYACILLTHHSSFPCMYYTRENERRKNFPVFLYMF